MDVDVYVGFSIRVCVVFTFEGYAHGPRAHEFDVPGFPRMYQHNLDLNPRASFDSLQGLATHAN